MDRVVLSNRFSRKAGVVVNPLAKYLGRKTNAVAIMANAAKASHATPTNALSPKTAPFSPTNCSVDKLVNNNEPATTGHANARPPVKYSSVALSDFFIRRTIWYVKKATEPVANTNEMLEIVFIFFLFDIYYSQNNMVNNFYVQFKFSAFHLSQRRFIEL